MSRAASRSQAGRIPSRREVSACNDGPVARTSPLPCHEAQASRVSLAVDELSRCWCSGTCPSVLPNCGHPPPIGEHEGRLGGAQGRPPPAGGHAGACHTRGLCTRQPPRGRSGWDLSRPGQPRQRRALGEADAVPPASCAGSHRYAMRIAHETVSAARSTAGPAVLHKAFRSAPASNATTPTLPLLPWGIAARRLVLMSGCQLEKRWRCQAPRAKSHR